MTKDKITEDMTIKEVIDKYPEVAIVFMKHNISCIGCPAASFERIKDIAGIHGTDVKTLLKDINEVVKNQ